MECVRGGGGEGGGTLVHLPVHIALSFSEIANSALNKSMCQWLVEVGNGLVVEAENGLVAEVKKRASSPAKEAWVCAKWG